jgi:hypothetical protein
MLALGLVAACTGPAPPADALDLAAFVDPPTAFGPHVRWWWPGGAVDEATIAREVGRLADAGFGGIEQQTLVFGLSDADVAADPRVRTVGTHAQLALVKAFLVAARARDLRASITLGSGWPSGGAFLSDVRPRELLLTRVDVEGPAELSIPEPVPAEPDWVRSANAVLPVLGPGACVASGLGRGRGARRRRQHPRRARRLPAAAPADRALTGGAAAPSSRRPRGPPARRRWARAAHSATNCQWQVSTMRSTKARTFADSRRVDGKTTWMGRGGSSQSGSTTVSWPARTASATW